MSRTVLIVDDNLINRSMLAAGLQDDYAIMEAADGKEALELIHRSYKLLSAVLLDIQMPVMDGFEVLRELKGNPVLAQLPVIVVTGLEDEGARLTALECGANDFVQKPYNPDIIRHCLRNNIALRESASIINAIQKDKLTGIYNREFFFEKAGELIRNHEPGTYILAGIDIDNFKLINDQYGAPMGNRILRHIGGVLKDVLEEVHGVCGRISGDNFAALYPNRPEVLALLTRRLSKELTPHDIPITLRFSVGRYVVTEPSLPVSAQYDRAFIAKQSVKGRYDKHLAYFDESMLRALVLEQEIIVEMAPALKKREFEVWLQPQYNHATGALIGSEALVRWRHPTKGLIYPRDFIPVFERNGFIYELDKFVWEETCRYIRKWLDEGRDPLPVSINLSRYDLFRDDLISVFSELLERYNIPVELLRLEITESAFSQSSEQLIAAVKRFIELRFTVEIDDFGSGYSSLNTLKDVPAQVLKLDMRFLEGQDETRRSGSILESITRMARWIGMAVIAEGVETIEQADYLKSIGCNYMQGYLYSRPLPLEEYEALVAGAEKERKLKSFEAIVTLDNDSFWDPASLDTLVFNSFVGGACIFELCDGKTELLRVNESFIRELGGSFEPGAALDKLYPGNYLDENGQETLRQATQRAAETGVEQSCALTLSDSGKYFPQAQSIRCALRIIARAGDRLLYYCVINNFTQQRQAESSKQSVIQQLQLLNDIARDLLAQSDVEDGLNTVLQKLREAFGGTRAYIFEYDFKKNIVSNTYESCAKGVEPEKGKYPNASLELASFWIETFKHVDHYVVDDVEALGPERGKEREALKARGVRSIFVAPLYRDGELMGLIGIDDPSRLFPQMNNMTALGDYVAVMLTRRDYSSQLGAEDKALLHQLRKPVVGLKEYREQGRRKKLSVKAFLHTTLVLVALMLALLSFDSPGRPGSHIDSFSETVLTLSSDWTLTPSDNVSTAVSLPLTIDYGEDGLYTLSTVLPQSGELINSPALCFYSNYTDLRIDLDGETLLTYPDGENDPGGATGNSYHFVRLPANFGGKTLSIHLRCQLGDDITYLIKAPLLGSKATMLRTVASESLFSIVLAGSLIILALVLAVLHISLRHKLELNSATAFTSVFAILFAFYVFLETSYAQHLGENPYRVFSATLLLLALLPLPLTGLFAEELSDRFKTVPLWVMGLCAVNFMAQAALHFGGILSLRVMLPVTHVTMIVTITVMAVFLFLSGRSDKPSAKRRLLAALPMVVGGMADIILLAHNTPSFNNSLWFTLGVTAFIIIQFCYFVGGFFNMYRSSMEVSVLKDMAYRDALTNIGNRNAYERKLKELSQRAVPPDLCCLVIDINDLKQINDGFGHCVGDAAIVETGRVLAELAPGSANCYRAGGDEFIVLIDHFDDSRAAALADKLRQEAKRRGRRYSIPLSLAVGSGCYKPSDGNLLDFIRRVDTCMYDEKREYKNSSDYPFKER